LRRTTVVLDRNGALGFQLPIGPRKDDRGRQMLKPQRAGQQPFYGRRPRSRSASITSTTSGQRHHGNMRWPRRPRRVAWYTPRRRWSASAPAPWWGHPVPSQPDFVLSPDRWTPPPGVLPAWSWLPPEGAAPRLDLVSWWVRGVVPPTVHRPLRVRMDVAAWGLGGSAAGSGAGAHLGHKIQGSVADNPGKRMPW
jgi:hypothetical protein